MCGIAGLFLGREPDAQHASQVKAMLDSLVHRGPDGSHVEARPLAVLGHARLAIIDLLTGDQPQSDASGRIHVVVNGEIYNYVELRRELEAKGHRFRTTSDIEVIPALWLEYGTEFVDHLRGMFAIALLDEREGEFVLVRDRVGKKPLYWAQHEGGIAFASELRCFDHLPGLDRRVDAEAIAHYLTWQYVPAPWSAYRGVRKLRAGEMLRIRGGGAPRLETYWDARPQVDEQWTGDALQQRLDDVIAEATRIRLRSDVPLGSFLSGGIDSGLVLSAASALEPSIEAITIGFGGSEEDERPLTRQTAQHLGVRLHEEDLSVDIVATVERVLSHLDEPLGDSSTVPTWLVCEATRRHAKVALSGDGGDESFAGYATRYGHSLSIENLRRYLPAAVRRPVLGALAAAWPGLATLPRPLRLKRVLAAAALELETAFLRDMSILRPEDAKRLLTGDFRGSLQGFSVQDWYLEIAARAAGADPLSRLLYIDRHSFLAEGVLAKVDRMSMAHGLEVRAPLLDQELVALSARVPAAEKYAQGKGKVCLRRLAAAKLPADVVRGGKKGFAPPLDGWMRGSLRPMFHDLVLSDSARTRAVVDPARLRTLVDEHESGRRHHGRLLWCLLVLERWCRERGASIA